MGDSVRDLMRKAAKDKQRKADAIAAAVAKSKGKEEVSGRAGNLICCIEAQYSMCC